jgi:hypothetical protein
VRFDPQPPSAPSYGEPVAPPGVLEDGTFQQVIDHPEAYQGKHSKEFVRQEGQTGRCPNCDGPNYFARTQHTKLSSDGRRIPPAPHCMDCGYNGMYDLQGEGINGVAGTGVRAGRQLASIGFQGKTIVGRVE